MQFPNLSTLERDCCGYDKKIWGFYQKDKEVAIGIMGEGWTLQVSLDELVTRAVALHGDYDPDEILIYYAVEYGTNDIEFVLYEIDIETETFISFPIINSGAATH